MPKVQLVSRFDFNWIEGHRKCFESHGWEFSWEKKAIFYESVDLYLLMWLDKDNYDFVMDLDVKNIMFIRRYEFYSSLVDSLDWSRVNRAVVLNPYYKKSLKKRVDLDAELIYNGVNLDKWSYKKRSHGGKIASIGMFNYKKNFPLAYQILAKFSSDYTLHIAGELQSSELFVYLDYLVDKMGSHRVFLDGHVDNIDSWLDNKNYILSTSIAEGCPNNVIEAMAKGIKPVIHNWPGAGDMFGEYVFNTVDEAVDMISPHTPYRSEEYRSKVENEFGPGCYEQLFELAKEVIGG